MTLNLWWEKVTDLSGLCWILALEIYSIRFYPQILMVPQITEAQSKTRFGPFYHLIYIQVRGDPPHLNFSLAVLSHAVDSLPNNIGSNISLVIYCLQSTCTLVTSFLSHNNYV